MSVVQSVFSLSFVAGLIAIIGFLVVPRLLKSVQVEEHQPFVDAMLSIVGTLISILLGLLVAAGLDHYNQLEQSVEAEAANIAQVFRLTYGLPAAPKAEIQEICRDYCQKVIDEEWPAMSERRPSVATLKAYLRLVRTVVQYEPQTEGQSNLHAALLQSTQSIGDCRRQRLMSINSTWKQHLLPVLFMCSAIVLAFTFVYARQGTWLHGVLICLVAVALGANLGLIVTVNNPFSGEWKINPRGFIWNLKVFDQIRTDPELHKLDLTGIR